MTDLQTRFEEAMIACPLVAILRGLKPEEAVEIGEALYGAGIRLMEVPLNSPRPLDSIEALSDAFQNHAVIGAGTVLKTEQVDEIAAAGGELPKLVLLIAARQRPSCSCCRWCRRAGRV